MKTLSKSFPAGLKYDIVYNPTVFISQSVEAVIQTMFEAVVLVVIVIILFLQTWRASIVPIVAIPVSLIGTFAVLSALGYSLNNLSLFGLLLAIGIVVDDAIVVVENVERNIREGLSPRDAAYKTMEEVGGALIAIALVLTAVFIPSVFLTGILGQFFRQFAVTIATSTVISLIVSLTLSPALCALLFKPHVSHPEGQSIFMRPINAFFRGFNRGFEWLSSRYGRMTGRLVRVSLIMVIVYAGLIGLTVFEFSRAPTGFIPQQDQGYLINIIQLPPGASLARTDEVARRVNKMVLDTPGVAHTVPDRRPRRRHLHQRAERGGDLQSARPLRRTRQGRADRDEDQHAAQSEIPDGAGRLGPERVAAAGPRHRHHRRLQARDPGHPRRRPRRSSRAWRSRSWPRPIRRRASPASSPPSTPARRRSGPISTASAPRCSASGPTTCSPRSKSISARNT